jgi:MFS family permease
MGVIYFACMTAGAFGYRIPPLGWKPEGWTPPAEQKAMITAHHVHLYRAPNTPQFWLLWGVLCMNVSAGIGVIGMASPMLQEVFGGRLIDVDLGFAALADEQRQLLASIGAGFTGLLSLFNILGRVFWSSLSDYIGRKRTYLVFFAFGMFLYASAPYSGQVGSVALFVGIFCVILTMYGGGFATIPAYLADMFGTQFVGAIHGRLLTAWSTAGILGPVLVNYIREYQLDRGVAPQDAYNTTMYVLAALLLVGLLCNALMRPVAARFYMSDAELEAERRLAHDPAAGAR